MPPFVLGQQNWNALERGFGAIGQGIGGGLASGRNERWARERWQGQRNATLDDAAMKRRQEREAAQRGIYSRSLAAGFGETPEMRAFAQKDAYLSPFVAGGGMPAGPSDPRPEIQASIAQQAPVPPPQMGSMPQSQLNAVQPAQAPGYMPPRAQADPNRQPGANQPVPEFAPQADLFTRMAQAGTDQRNRSKATQDIAQYTAAADLAQRASKVGPEMTGAVARVLAPLMKMTPQEAQPFIPTHSLEGRAAYQRAGADARHQAFQDSLAANRQSVEPLQKLMNLVVDEDGAINEDTAKRVFGPNWEQAIATIAGQLREVYKAKDAISGDPVDMTQIGQAVPFGTRHYAQAAQDFGTNLDRWFPPPLNTADPEIQALAEEIDRKNGTSVVSTQPYDPNAPLGPPVPRLPAQSAAGGVPPEMQGAQGGWRMFYPRPGARTGRSSGGARGGSSMRSWRAGDMVQ